MRGIELPSAFLLRIILKYSIFIILSEIEFRVTAQFLAVQVGSWRLIDIDSYYGLLKLKFCQIENQQEYLSW